MALKGRSRYVPVIVERYTKSSLRLNHMPRGKGLMVNWLGYAMVYRVVIPHANHSQLDPHAPVRVRACPCVPMRACVPMRTPAHLRARVCARASVRGRGRGARVALY
jgi:hypothetical protein